ncbi:uncharacterized protein LOC115920524 [Strongylocentrotus purpuratus]|uniref:Uncharacterized protein n=1 Tax=Strongylocentrotus purpuratus TaxID=7668 RepID=A0A7M7N7B3_STRPU|nr:uncharacterized protein LOC115920524 [Strongylocentrotus purpuratus]
MSFAFYLFTANGTVYSWGGGVDGQLGHGEDVQYLAQPEALADGALPGRVAQVACGDSYSAALLGDGSLYMWGKSSHVIQADQPSSQKVYRPVGISLNGRSIAMVTCGSWHTAAITGKPERQPLEEDSDTSEEEEEDLDALITMETGDGRDAFQDRADNFWDMSHETASPEKNNATSNPPAVNNSMPPYRLAREGTTLTLEEFYSATPVPSNRPRELRRASLTERKRAAQEEKVQGADDRVNAEMTAEESAEDAGRGRIADDSSVDENVDADSVIMTPSKDSTEEPQTLDKYSRPETEPDNAFPKSTLPPSGKVTVQPQRDMSLSRSKTMGSINVPKKSVPKETYQGFMI